MKYKIIGVIVIIIGIGLCIYSVNFYKKEQTKHETYIDAVATVVGYEDCEFSDGDIGSKYIAEYKIKRNTYQIKSTDCTNVPKKIGKEVKIKYNPRNPSDAIFTNDITRYLLPSIGIMFVMAGVIVFRKTDN